MPSLQSFPHAARPSRSRVAWTAAPLLALLAPTALGQAEWSGEFGRPGLVGRLFELGEYQGELIAGGLSIEGGGQDLGLVARFDGASWQPLGGGISGGNNQQVRAALEWQGALYVGGQFCCAAGLSVSNLARWDGTGWSPVGGGVPGVVWALEEYQGELYVAGQFTSAGGVAVANIARWDGTQWHDVGGGLDKSFDPEVHALRAAPDGKLYAAGEFDTAGGAPAANVAVWDGTGWAPLAGGLPGPLNGLVWDLEWYQSKLWACGNFDLVAGGAGHEKVALWDGASWTAGGVFPDTSIGTTVYDLEVDGAALWAAGNFTTADSVPVWRLSRYDGAQWTDSGGIHSIGSPPTVLAVKALNGRVYFGGELSLAGFGFPSPQSIASESIAAFDGASWSAVGLGLGFDHEVFGSTLWNGKLVCVGNFSTAGAHQAADVVMLEGGDWVQLAGVTGTVRSVAVWNGDLVIGGSFTSVDGVPTVNAARYDGVSWHALSGANDNALEVFQGEVYSGGTGGVLRWSGSSWQSFAPQLFGYVYDLHAHAGALYIGGDMSSSGNLASWDGATQQTVGGGTNGAVRTLASLQGELLVGGEFSQAGGAPANRLARWDGAAFHEVPGIDGLEVIAVTAFQGQIVASGHLVYSGLPPDKYIARFVGGSWHPLGLGLDAPAFTLTPDDAAGRLYAGGNIREADGHPSWYFARWDESPDPPGTPLCFGDGSGATCPCGNFAPLGGCANSTGAGCALAATGSDGLGAGDLALHASGAIPGQPGLFFQGDVATGGGDGLVFGDGLRCCGQNVVRLEVRPPDAAGEATTTVDVGATGGAAPGETKCYQYWYRDPLGGPCGAGFNLSNGYSVTWEP